MLCLLRVIPKDKKAHWIGILYESEASCIKQHYKNTLITSTLLSDMINEINNNHLL